MSALLTILILAGVVWFVLAMAGVRSGSRREPMVSVTEFARAMTALDPTAPPVRRPAPQRR